MKKALIVTGILIILAIVARFILGGPEDSWICQNGTWVRHGNPSRPSPENPCE